jgi:hypothetical protein
MRSKFFPLIIAMGFFCLVSGQSPDLFRTYFEWGEYQKLIDTLEPFLAKTSDKLAPAVLARYHVYLGVAHYGQGRVDEAQQKFLTALSYDTLVAPDREYLSDEIIQLFSATRLNFMEKQQRLRSKDSLLLVKQKAFDENLKALKTREFRKSTRNNAVLAVSLLSIGVVLGGISAYEFRSTKTTYLDFKEAARTGDKETYDNLRPEIQEGNLKVAGASIAAAVTAAAGIGFCIRFFIMKPEL